MGIEIGFTVGAWLRISDARRSLGATIPEACRTILRQAARFEELANRLYEEVRRDRPEAEAAALRDYFLEVYFNKNLFFILSPLENPELKAIRDRHPVLQRNHVLPAAIWQRNQPLGAPTFGDYLEGYREVFENP